MNSVSLAATWDNHVIEDICEVLISEARSKEVDILLGPAGEWGYFPSAEANSH